MKNALMKIIGSLWPTGRRPAAPSPGLNLSALEAHMKTMPGQIEIPVEHVFSGGIYLRSITIPAGALVMGKRHRGATCNILMKGKLAVYTTEHEPPTIIEAPRIFTSPPYAKKFAYCIEEAVFVNAFPTDETDPERIEARVIIPEREYLEMKEAQQCLS